MGSIHEKKTEVKILFYCPFKQNLNFKAKSIVIIILIFMFSNKIC